MSQAAEREYTANTVDETVWVRVAGTGEVLGVQLEPPVMERPGRRDRRAHSSLCRCRVFRGTGGAPR